MATQKKVTRVEGGSGTAESTRKFVPTAESKSKASKLRIIAVILWCVAIAAQVWAIVQLFRPPVSTTWVIVAIAIDLAAVIAGSLLWKKSNRFDPASREDGFRFFLQNQLGAFAAGIAFLPLFIFVLGSKNLDKKQKTVLGSVAGGALVIAALFGIDFNPPSVEQYTEEANRVEWLNNGQDYVYWTKAGTVYHVYSDCPYINTDRTTEIFEGTVAQAHEMKKLTRLCSRCEHRAIDEHHLDEAAYESTLQQE